MYHVYAMGNVKVTIDKVMGSESAPTLGLETHQAIQEVIHRYFGLVDAGRFLEVSALFSANASLTFGPGTPKPGTLTGEEIVAFLEARARQADVVTRHVISNIRLIQHVDGSVSSNSVLTLYRSSSVTPLIPGLIADVEDKFVQYDGRWLIEERAFLPVFH